MRSMLWYEVLLSAFRIFKTVRSLLVFYKKNETAYSIELTIFIKTQKSNMNIVSKSIEYVSADNNRVAFSYTDVPFWT